MMIALLAKKMIPDHENIENEKVRRAYGNLTSTVGIANNILLFVFKFIAGIISEYVVL